LDPKHLHFYEIALDEDITLYVKFLEGSDEVLETLLQVCAVNSLVIIHLGKLNQQTETYPQAQHLLHTAF
jgi:hypothetical protein